jgi:hypothetical protein
VVDVITIGGGLHVLPGTASPFEVDSLPEALVSMNSVLKRAKKFRAMIFLGGMFKAGNILVRTAAFFEVKVVRLFCLRTSWKPSSCVVCCPVVFGRLVWPTRVLD